MACCNTPILRIEHCDQIRDTRKIEYLALVTVNRKITKLEMAVNISRLIPAGGLQYIKKAEKPGALSQNLEGWSEGGVNRMAQLAGQVVTVQISSDNLIITPSRYTEEITYTTPASVRKMIEAKGDGYGINNTPGGLIVSGEMYAKGSKFFVVDGIVYEHPDTNPILKVKT